MTSRPDEQRPLGCGVGAISPIIPPRPDQSRPCGPVCARVDLPESSLAGGHKSCVVVQAAAKPVDGQVSFEGIAQRAFPLCRSRAATLWILSSYASCFGLVLARLIKRANGHAKHRRGSNAKQPLAPPSANRLEMCSIRTRPFVALVLFFFFLPSPLSLFVCLKGKFSSPSSPAHPNWVTINGPIVKVSGCCGSSRGEEEGGHKLEGKERGVAGGGDVVEFLRSLFAGLEDGAMATSAAEQESLFSQT